jgi:hypothetical protein
VGTSGASYSNGGIKLAQSTGGNTSSGGSGKTNTIEEQTGKTTSDAPGTIDPKEIEPKDTTGSIPKSVPDNREPSPMGNTDPSGPTVK